MAPGSYQLYVISCLRVPSDSSVGLSRPAASSTRNCRILSANSFRAAELPTSDDQSAPPRNVCRSALEVKPCSDLDRAVLVSPSGWNWPVLNNSLASARSDLTRSGGNQLCSTATPPCAIFSMDPGLRSDGAATLALLAAVLEGPDAENACTHTTGKRTRERKTFMVETRRRTDDSRPLASAWPRPGMMRNDV